LPGDGRQPDPLAALPAAYARWRASPLGRITDALELDLILERIGPPEGLRILDVGCGDGVLAVELSRRGADVAGVDASEAMVAAAKARAGAENLPVGFEQAQADALPFPDETFDVVTAVTVLCFIDDADRAMREMVRVLKPGGRLVLGELGRLSLWALLRRIKGWLGSATWRAARFRTPGELSALAERAGLSEIKVSGAIFYPPIGIAALLMGRLDRFIGSVTSFRAAFLLLVARKPNLPARQTTQSDQVSHD